MKSSNLFNCAVRIIKEPINMSPIENGYSIIGKGPDVKNVQSRIPQEYTTRKEYNENCEAEFDQIEIEYKLYILRLEEVNRFAKFKSKL
uniref:Uncharacterized protein n=1 Tax=Trichogramma kaykai TaxID=54128 RepID=A0ABD2XAQ1_9HYME